MSAVAPVARAGAPGRGWYWLAGAVAVSGVVAMVALVVFFVLDLEKGSQFVAPGRHTVELTRPGRYLIWNDHTTVFEGLPYNESESLPAGVRVSVADRSGGPSPEVRASQRATSTIGDTSSTAAYQFDIDRPGRYEVVVEGDFPPRVFSVSRDFFSGLLWTIFGSFATLFGGFGAAAAIAAWAFIRREEAASAARRAAAPAVPGAAAAHQSLKTLTAIVYGLQLASFLVGITIMAAIIINYLKRSEVQGTWLESHFRWQIRTFWFSVLWLGVGMATAVLLIGFVVLLGAAVWLLYRAIRGWIALEEGRPLYVKA